MAAVLWGLACLLLRQETVGTLLVGLVLAGHGAAACWRSWTASSTRPHGEGVNA